MFTDFFPKIKRKINKTRQGVFLGAVNGRVVLHHPDGQLVMTPALARQIAAELPRFARLAEIVTLPPESTNV